MCVRPSVNTARARTVLEIQARPPPALRDRALRSDVAEVRGARARASIADAPSRACERVHSPRPPRRLLIDPHPVSAQQRHPRALQSRIPPSRDGNDVDGFDVVSSSHHSTPRSSPLLSPSLPPESRVGVGSGSKCGSASASRTLDAHAVCESRRARARRGEARRSAATAIRFDPLRSVPLGVERRGTRRGG